MKRFYTLFKHLKCFLITSVIPSVTGHFLKLACCGQQSVLTDCFGGGWGFVLVHKIVLLFHYIYFQSNRGTYGYTLLIASH